LRSKSRMVGSLGQPILFLLALGYGFGPTYQKAGQGNYLEFLAPGIIAMSILFTAIFNGVELIWDRQFGFLKETLVAPVSRLNIMIGRTVGGATVACLQGLIVLIISLFAGFHLDNYLTIIPAFGVMFLIAILFTALGTAIASRLEDMHGFQLIMNFLIMPIFFLSGALFPLKGLSGKLLTITKFNPLSYGVDALRDILTNNVYYGLTIDIAVLSVCTLACLLIGSYLFTTTEV
jgi:ABC-2 type transport system permease protein